MNPRLTHLEALEAGSIHIFREVTAQFAKPVTLYSIGEDLSVMPQSLPVPDPSVDLTRSHTTPATPGSLLYRRVPGISVRT